MVGHQDPEIKTPKYRLIAQKNIFRWFKGCVWHIEFFGSRDVTEAGLTNGTNID